MNVASELLSSEKDYQEFLNILDKFKIPYEIENINNDTSEVIIGHTEMESETFSPADCASLRVTFKNGKIELFSIWDY